MRIADLLTLYDYNSWATGRILAAAARVAGEQFVAASPNSYGGLRGTLVHTLDAEYGWRMLCQHNMRTPDMAAGDFPTLADLRQRWLAEEQEMRAYLAGLGDDDVMGRVRYTTDSGLQRDRVLWHCLWHVVNHGTQHRSEAAALLTGYGQSPGDLDFTVFLSDPHI